MPLTPGPVNPESSTPPPCVYRFQVWALNDKDQETRLHNSCSPLASPFHFLLTFLILALADSPEPIL